MSGHIYAEYDKDYGRISSMALLTNILMTKRRKKFLIKYSSRFIESKIMLIDKLMTCLWMSTGQLFKDNFCNKHLVNLSIINLCL